MARNYLFIYSFSFLFILFYQLLNIGTNGCGGRIIYLHSGVVDSIADGYIATPLRALCKKQRISVHEWERLQCKASFRSSALTLDCCDKPEREGWTQQGMVHIRTFCRRISWAHEPWWRLHHACHTVAFLLSPSFATHLWSESLHTGCRYTLLLELFIFSILKDRDVAVPWSVYLYAGYITR